MQAAFELASKFLYLAAAVLLTLFSLGMILMAGQQVIGAILGWADLPVATALFDAVGLVIISIATFDMGKYLVEEEILRSRELRSAREARRSLTKFMTIIIVAASLESIVLVFRVHEGGLPQLLYPALLLLAAVLALVGLGLFQWLSRNAEQAPDGPPDRPGGD